MGKTHIKYRDYSPFEYPVTWIGWETCWDADGQWSNCLYVNFNDDKLKLNANRADNANDNYGSAVAFPGLL